MGKMDKNDHIYLGLYTTLWRYNSDMIVNRGGIHSIVI